MWREQELINRCFGSWIRIQTEEKVGAKNDESREDDTPVLVTVSRIPQALCLISTARSP